MNLSAALLAVVCCICAIALNKKLLNASLQDLLSYSAAAPLPLDEIDVAVILGYALHKNSSLTEPLKARVQSGVDLYAQGRVRALVFSGSVPHGSARDRAEADVMQEYAAHISGLDPAKERWFIEGASRNTYQNAVYSAEIVCEHRWPRVAVVTSPFHQLRSYHAFVKALAATPCGSDVQVYVAAVPALHHQGYGAVLDDWMDLWDCLRELGALAKYRLQGYI